MSYDLSTIVPLGEEEISDRQIPASETFHIHDDATANWLIKKIVEARAYSKHCEEWCAREQARARRDEEFLLFRFGQQLLDHAHQRISEDGGRRKSVNLPAGTIGFRQEGPKLIIDDEAAVIEWATPKARSRPPYRSFLFAERNPSKQAGEPSHDRSCQRQGPSALCRCPW